MADGPEYARPAEVDAWFKDNSLVRDLYGLVTGKRLGAGIAREVYEFAPDRSLVIKFEVAVQSFQNVQEWYVWDRVREVKGVARWFAPCVHIAPSGGVLLQRRVDQARAKEFPARVPGFFTDTKRDNWGVLDGRLVCCDYGTNLMAENGMSAKMRKAEWWD